MVKKKKLNKSKNSKNFQEVKNLSGALEFLKSGKTMFSGMKMGLSVGDKAFVLGSPVNMKGHMPAAKFAQLSDGSKLTLQGPNKGLIVK